MLVPNPFRPLVRLLLFGIAALALSLPLAGLVGSFDATLSTERGHGASITSTSTSIRVRAMRCRARRRARRWPALRRQGVSRAGVVMVGTSWRRRLPQRRGPPLFGHVRTIPAA